MTTLTLSETAQKHDVAKSSLSEAVHDRRPVHGMNLYRYAVIENGRIKKFGFPSWYCFPDDENDKNEETEETIFMTTEEICREHSAFHRGKVEHALRKEWRIDGFPVYEWVVHDEGGSWDGFEVPKSADFDGPRLPNVPSTKGNSEGGEKRLAQRNGPNETSLSEDDDSLDEEEIAENGQKATQSLLALGCAIGVSALTNG